jgi:hypothetical protein
MFTNGPTYYVPKYKMTMTVYQKENKYNDFLHEKHKSFNDKINANMHSKIQLDPNMFPSNRIRGCMPYFKYLQ